MWYFQSNFPNWQAFPFSRSSWFFRTQYECKVKVKKRCTVNKFGRWCGEIWCDFNMFSSTAFACVEKLWPSIQSKQYTCSPKKKKVGTSKSKFFPTFLQCKRKASYGCTNFKRFSKLMFWFLELVHHDIIFPLQILHPQALLDLQSSCFWK